MLPDVALLEIFDFYVYGPCIEAWHTLVHVCREWRGVVFGSPRRLNLRLLCTGRTPVRETLYVWPVLPIAVFASYESWDADNIIAVLQPNDRICQMRFHECTSSQFEKVLTAMQQPFPALTYLDLWLTEEITLIVPDSFLDGSAPQLQTLILGHIPFPGIPKLLLSATHLVELRLHGIPHSGYFSPEAMATCLSVLSLLEYLAIGFESPRSRPDQKGRRPPPLTRTLLPVLTELTFKGVSEYLEDLLARIDAPLLDKSSVIFFHQLIFDMPQLGQFISRTPKFKAHDQARVSFSDWGVQVTLGGSLDLAISCRKPDWQLSSLAQICSSSFLQTLVPMVECLSIEIAQVYLDEQRWQYAIENSQWLELLHPFAAVKDLYISEMFTPYIAPALQELSGESMTEVLPALQSLFLERYPLDYSRLVQESIGQFVSARQLAGHPIAVSRWEVESQ